MEVKTLAWLLFDTLGLSTLLVSAFSFNLSDAEKFVTWFLAVVFAVLRIGIVYQNYKSKKLDNEMKRIDSLRNVEKFNNEHK